MNGGRNCVICVETGSKHPRQSQRMRVMVAAAVMKLEVEVNLKNPMKHNVWQPLAGSGTAA